MAGHGNANMTAHLIRDIAHDSSQAQDHAMNVDYFPL